jgi:hypothetical protein
MTTWGMKLSAASFKNLSQTTCIGYIKVHQLVWMEVVGVKRRNEYEK